MSGTWHKVGHKDDFEDGRFAYRADSFHIGIFLCGEDVFAIDNLCTHGNALLTDGELEDCLIECPLHAGLVDVRTGKAAGAPINRDARAYRARIENGAIFLELPE